MTTAHLQFGLPEPGDVVDFPVRRILIAGFTGRDAQAVQAHLDELRALGVPTPPAVPVVMEVDPSLATANNQIEVTAPFTSGEVEPVLLVGASERWLTVGSDHTDRDLERKSIPESKQACPKVLAADAIPLALIGDLDRVELMSWAAPIEDPYQFGSMSEILPLAEIERAAASFGLSLQEGDVVFLGTVPVASGGLRPTERFRASLYDPMSGHRIELDYHVEVLAPKDPGGAEPQKPEQEFRPVTDVEWAPVDERVPGLVERVLVREGDSPVATRLLRFEPGTDTSPMGLQRHDFWEEVYILEGAFEDLSLGETFSSGSYACRPPGMPHGPWVAASGCTTFEVRYTKSAKPAP